MSREKPTTEVSGVRSSWLTLDRKALLVADASSATTRAAWASSIATARAAVRSTTRRSRASFWDSTSPYSRAFSMAAAIRLPTVYSSGPSPGRTSRPERAVVDREHADGPALGHQRGPEERGDLHHPGERPVALVGILVDVAEEERPIGLVELDQVRGRPGRAAGAGSVIAAVISGLPPTDRPSVSTSSSVSASRIERAIEPEMAGDGDERAVEQLVAIERRAGRGGQLVEGHQLGDPLVQVLVGELRALVGVLGQPLLRAQVLRPPARRAAVQHEPGRQQRGEHDRHRLVGRSTRHEVGEHEDRRGDAEQDGPTIHRSSRVRVSP